MGNAQLIIRKSALEKTAVARIFPLFLPEEGFRSCIVYEAHLSGLSILLLPLDVTMGGPRCPQKIQKPDYPLKYSSTVEPDADARRVTLLGTESTQRFFWGNDEGTILFSLTRRVGRCQRKGNRAFGVVNGD